MKLFSPKGIIGENPYIDHCDNSIQLTVNRGAIESNRDRILPEYIKELQKQTLVTALIAHGGLCLTNGLKGIMLVSDEDNKETYVHIPNTCINCGAVSQCPFSVINHLRPSAEQLQQVEAMKPGESINI